MSHACLAFAPMQRLTRLFARTQRRYASSTAPQITNAPSEGTVRQSRFKKIVSEMRKKPGTHLTAFLILHELTAVLPLFPLYYFFQWTDMAPAFLGGPMVGAASKTLIPSSFPYIGGQRVGDVATDWIDSIARTVARVGSKYGVMGFHKVQELRGKEKAIVEEEGANALRQGISGVKSGVRGTISETVSGVSIRNVMDGVAAYVVVKAMLPFRLALSVSATPWFATRILGPALNGILRRKTIPT